MADDNKEKAQQMYSELQMIAGHMKQLQEQLEALEGQVLDNNKTQTNLEEIKNVEENTDIFAPVAAGIFIKAQIKDTKNVIVNVGGNTMVPKTTDAAKALLTEQLSEIRKVQHEITEQMAKLTKEAQVKEAQLVDLMK